MRDPVLSVLLRLEARRAWEFHRKGLPAMTAVMAVLFAILGGGPYAASVVLAAAASVLLLHPVARGGADKLDGTMEFLTSLPVEPARLARAKALALAGHALVPALAATGAAAAAAPGVLSLTPGPWALVGVFAVVWVGATAFLTLAVGALLRFEVETLQWLPMLLFVLLLTAIWLVDRAWPDAPRVVLGWWVAPPHPVALVLATGALGGVALGVGVLLLRAGYRRFNPSTVALPPHAMPFPS